VYARNRGLTGKLELRGPDECGGTIDFWDGRIGAVRTPPFAYFGTVAHELGLIDSATLDATLLEIATKKRLHGEVLIDRGAISPLQRDDVLAEQACRKIHPLFSLPPEASGAHASFSFRVPFAPGSSSPPSSPLSSRPPSSPVSSSPPPSALQTRPTGPYVRAIQQRSLSCREGSMITTFEQQRTSGWPRRSPCRGQSALPERPSLSASR
jgi:hypothetical protein